MNAQKIRDAITHDIHCLGCGEGFDCGRQIALRELDVLEAQLRARDEALRVAREVLEALKARGEACTCDRGYPGSCGCGGSGMAERAQEGLDALAAIGEATRAP